MLAILLLILGQFGRSYPPPFINAKANNSFSNTKNEEYEHAGTNAFYDRNNFNKHTEVNQITKNDNFNEHTKVSEIPLFHSDEHKQDDFLQYDIVPEYPNKPIIPDSSDKQLVAFVPVVISQFELEIATEAEIDLDRLAIEIKRINNKVYLEQCRLIPEVNKLFIKGFVRTSIEYASFARETDLKDNKLRHITKSIPFSCTTVVSYLTPPKFKTDHESYEIEIVGEDSCVNDLSEKNYTSHINFNEKIHCKLVKGEISQLAYAEYKDLTFTANEKPFQRINQKLVLLLNIKLMQNQEAII